MSASSIAAETSSRILAQRPLTAAAAPATTSVAIARDQHIKATAPAATPTPAAAPGRVSILKAIAHAIPGINIITGIMELVPAVRSGTTAEKAAKGVAVAGAFASTICTAFALVGGFSMTGLGFGLAAVTIGGIGLVDDLACDGKMARGVGSMFSAIGTTVTNVTSAVKATSDATASVTGFFGNATNKVKGAFSWVAGGWRKKPTPVVAKAAPAIVATTPGATTPGATTPGATPAAAPTAKPGPVVPQESFARRAGKAVIDVPVATAKGAADLATRGAKAYYKFEVQRAVATRDFFGGIWDRVWTKKK